MDMERQKMIERLGDVLTPNHYDNVLTLKDKINEIISLVNATRVEVEILIRDKK
jgi:hypothetical protein